MSGANTRSAWPCCRTAVPQRLRARLLHRRADQDARRGAATACCPATSPRPRSGPPPGAPAACGTSRSSSADPAAMAGRAVSTSSSCPRSSTTSADADLDQVLDRASRALAAGRDAARRALAASGGRLPAVRRRRAPGAGRPARAGPAGPHTRSPTSWPRSTSAPTASRSRWPRRRAWCDRGSGDRGVGVVVPAHNEETLLPACLAALRRAARPVQRAGARAGGRRHAARDRTAAVARPAGPGDQHPGPQCGRRAGRRDEALRLTAGPDPAASGWRPPTPTRSCPRAGCGASSPRRPRAGTWFSVRSP